MLVVDADLGELLVQATRDLWALPTQVATVPALSRLVYGQWTPAGVATPAAMDAASHFMLRLVSTTYDTRSRYPTHTSIWLNDSVLARMMATCSGFASWYVEMETLVFRYGDCQHADWLWKSTHVCMRFV